MTDSSGRKLLDESSVEELIVYFHDPTGPAETDLRGMRELVHDFVRFEKIVETRGIERGDANRLAWGFVRYQRQWLKQREELFTYYQRLREAG